MNWTLEDVIEFIEACYDRDTILDVLMGYSAYWFPARMILIVGRAWVQLFSTTAFDLPTDIAREQRRADVADDAPAVNEDTATGTADEIGLGQLFDQLGLGHPLVRTVGVRIGARVAIVLVGVVHDEGVETGGLEAAAAAAGRQLEDVIRMAKADELPPVEDRVPAFPAAREETSRGPGSDARVEGRTTQNLEVGFDHEAALSSPRLTMTVPDDDSDDEPEINPSATSFGLPFVPGDVAVPGRAVADDSAASEAEAALSPTSESSETREGAVFRSEASLASEAHEELPESFIGSPFLDEPFPSDPEDADGPESDAIVLVDQASGVDIVSPTDISSNESNRTQLGGLSVASDSFQAEPSLVEESFGTVIGAPRMASEATSTQLGGVVGEPDVVQETLGRADSSASDDNTDTRASGLHGAWVNSRTDGGVPTAMILKPARRRRSTSPASESPPVKAEPKPSHPLMPAPIPAPKSAPKSALKSPRADDVTKFVKNAETLAPTGAPERKAESPPKPTTHDERTRVDTSALDSRGERPQGGGTERLASGGWARKDESTRRFDADAEVDDAWFDYFADEAQDQGKPEPALNFSLSEPSDDPHTIPPETLERLLDSGPEMVDMQEQFMILDSRDREKAFEAAERVAELGSKAIEVLDLMFPGRVFLDRYQFGDELPPVDKHGPVLHALVRLGDLALPIAKSHLTDTSNEARFYAVYLLTKLDAESVLPELFGRLFDRDQQIRKIAGDLVLQYQAAEAFDADVRAKIRGELLSEDDVHVTVAAALLARLCDVEAIETLIDAMDDSATPRVKLAILNALTEITLHHWSSPYEWRQWWRNAKNQRREDWLVEALDAASADLRRRAYEEVQRLPGLELNYHHDQPGKLRKRAQDELRSWFKK